MNKKVMLLGLSVMMLFSIATPTYATDVSTEKEEVVYVMADAQGTIKNASVVNVFDSGDIIDYANYEKVEVLNTTDEINQQGERISLSTDSDKLYYQGTLEKVEMPWNIAITYFLDDKEYSAADVAGKSGNFEMKLAISKNENCQGSFYEDYALQINVTLDTNNSSDIVADGATVVNVGNKKQLSYIVLPNKGLNASVKAKVNDFEMDKIAINGMQLNLNVDFEDEDLKGKVNKLISATTQLNDGVTELRNGNEALKTGSQSLTSGARELESGVSSLDTGIVSLQNGMQQMQNGFYSLNSKSKDLINGSSNMKNALILLQNSLSAVSNDTDELSKITNSSSQIKTGIYALFAGATALQNNVGYTQYKTIMQGNGLNIDALASNNTSAIQTITGQIQSLQALLPQISGNPELTNQINAQIVSLQNVILLLQGNNHAISGTETYLNGLSGSVSKLTKGLNNLNSQYETFDTAIQHLTTNLGDILTNVNTLSNALNEIVAQYENLDTGISEYTNGVATLIAGYQELVSGITELSLGSKELKTGSNNLSYGTDAMYQNIEKLYSGAMELSAGSQELKDQTSTMESNLESQINELLSSIGGDSGNPVSFVSDKNTNVKSVQFVIQSDAIEKQKETISTEITTEKSNSLWDKLQSLF